MIGVNHVVPQLQVTKVGKKATQLMGTTFLGSRRLTKEISAGKNGLAELGKNEAVGEVAEVQSHRAGFYRPIVRQARRHIRFLQDLDQSFGETAVANENMNLSERAFLPADLVDEILDIPTKHR